MRALSLVLFLSGMFAVASLSPAQPPEGGKGKGDGKTDKGGKGFGKGGPGGFGFGAGPAIGQIMPTFIQEQLKLTDAQKKELEAMQKDIDAKLDKILTEDQRKQLKEMKERRPGGFGGPGGFPGQPGEKGGGPGEKGGKGDKGGKGNPPPQQ